MRVLQKAIILSVLILLSLNTIRSEEVSEGETQTISESENETETQTQTETETETETILESENGTEKVKTDELSELEETQADSNLASIDVTGVSDKLKKNIELHMPLTIPVCDADRGDVRLFFDTVKKNLQKATRALGYYDAEFTSGGSIVDECWALRLKVTAGKPIKVISQEIKVLGDGQNEEVFQTILKDLPYEIGDILNHQKYSEFKTELSEASQTLGYFDAEYEQHSIRIDPASYQATVTLNLNTGSRYRYGDVIIEQRPLSDKAIQKYIIIESGEPYKGEDLIRQQQILLQSGYYKTIKIEVLHDDIKNEQVPVSIVLEPKKRNAYKFKVGYGSDTGARVSAELDRRWTGSKGKQLQAKAQYAETLSEISFKLLNPREKPEDNTLVYNLDWTKDSNDDVVGRSFNIGGSLIRKREYDWIQSVSLNALIDRTRVEGEDETRSKLLLFGVGIEKVKADNLIYPTDGWRLRLALSAAAELILSDQNVLQFTANARRILKLGSGQLLGRVNYGSTLVSDFERLPKSLRFFAGGANSVRGYDFESLGELNDNNRNRGGKQLIDFSVEYQHPIDNGWSAAVFVDAGNAFDDFEDADLEVGVGFGARWRSPVGPVKIDLGFPIDDFSSPKLYLSVGSDL